MSSKYGNTSMQLQLNKKVDAYADAYASKRVAPRVSFLVYSSREYSLRMFPGLLFFVNKKYENIWRYDYVQNTIL